MSCTVPGCDYPVLHASAMLCSRHYQRKRRHGSPTGGGTYYGDGLKWLREALIDPPNECVIWPFGRFADGYAAIQVDGRKYRASRYVCQLVHGEPESKDLAAAHRCGRGQNGCINPKHLYWATQAQNIADQVTHGTATRGSRNGYAKLTEAAAQRIRALQGTGRLQREIAAEFGVSRELVGRIWRREAWAWM